MKFSIALMTTLFTCGAFAAQLAEQNQRIAYSLLKLRFQGVAATPPETSSQRTVTYSASTCLTDRLTGQKLAQTAVEVAYITKDHSSADVMTAYEKMRLITDDEGCVSWNAYVWNPRTSENCFYEKNIKVKAVGAERVFTAYLNPEDDKPTFGFEKREIGNLESIGLSLRLCEKQ